MRIMREKNQHFLLYLHFKILVGFVNANIIWKKIRIYNISDCKKSKLLSQQYLSTFNSVVLFSLSGM